MPGFGQRCLTVFVRAVAAHGAQIEARAVQEGRKNRQFPGMVVEEQDGCGACVERQIGKSMSGNEFARLKAAGAGLCDKCRLRAQNLHAYVHRLCEKAERKDRRPGPGDRQSQARSIEADKRIALPGRPGTGDAAVRPVMSRVSPVLKFMASAADLRASSSAQARSMREQGGFWSK